MIRECLRPAMLACLLALLAACGGGSSGSTPPPDTGNNPPPAGGDNSPGDGDRDGDGGDPPADTKPDEFAFAPVSNLFLETLATSEAVEIKGIDAAADIAVTGGEYAINDQPFTAAPGTVNAGDRVRVRAASGAQANQAVKVILDIGGVKGEYVLTTGPVVNFADVDPAAFTLIEPPAVEKGAALTSDAFTVTGINAPAPIVITGGEYRIEDGEFTSEPGLVLPGQRVQVRAVASNDDGTVNAAALRIGGFTESFTLVTAPAEGQVDTIPDFFAFAPVVGAETDAPVDSPAITVSGLSGDAPITVTGGEYSLGSGFTSLPGTVTNGSNVTVRLLTSPAGHSTSTAKVTIGDVPGHFTVTTRDVPFGSDSAPNPNSFIFGTTETSSPGIQVESAWRFPLDFDAPAKVSVEGGEYRIDAGAFTSQPQLIRFGQAIRLRGMSPGTVGETSRVTVTIGGESTTFDIRTVAPPSDNHPPNLDDVGIFVVGNDEIHLDAMGAVDEDAGDEIESITWTLESGPGDVEIVPDGAAFGYAVATFSLGGTYTFKVTAFDGELESERIFSISVDSPNTPPQAHAAAAPASPSLGETVTLAGEGSFDNEGPIAAYRWELLSVPAGSVAVIDAPDSMNTSFQPDKEGTYEIALTVTDDQGESDTASATVVVGPPEPLVPVITVLTASPTAGQPVELSAENSTGVIVTYSWFMSSAPSTRPPIIVDPDNNALASFTPQSAGEYKVELSVSEADGETDFRIDTIVVN